MFLERWLAILWIGLSSCATASGPRPGMDPAEAARGVEHCANGRDDDGDRLVDCEDPDCSRSCDRDGDGFSVPEDCDDDDPSAWPGAPVVCDDTPDNDCDGRVDPLDVDHNGDGRSWCEGDCGELSAVESVDPPVDRYACGWCPLPVEVHALDEEWVERFLDPCLLDPAAVFHCGPGEDDLRFHAVLHRSDVPLRPETMVFFPPGAGRETDRLRSYAAGAGYKTLSLAYWNDGLPEDRCNERGGTCWERVRTEVFTGLDTWPTEDVAPADAISRRLVVALNHLAETEPELGWDRHLGAVDPASGLREVLWEELVLVGYSEGSGYVAFAAKRYRVRAALMISGPPDTDRTDPLIAPAPWVLVPGATPACAHWGFRHVHEGYLNMARVWTGLGIAETPVLVEDSAPPYEGSHWLETSLRSWRGESCNAHQSTAVDHCMHRDLGEFYLHFFCSAAAPCE